MATIKFKKINENAILPKYQSAGASGMDISSIEEVTIKPHEHKLVHTGIKADIPAGYEIQVRPRSGLALKFGITVLNSPGTIDEDYTGEICVILVNHSSVEYTVHAKDRIAQLVAVPVQQLDVVEIDELKSTVRGENGFGSSGV